MKVVEEDTRRRPGGTPNSNQETTSFQGAGNLLVKGKGTVGWSIPSIYWARSSSSRISRIR